MAHNGMRCLTWETLIETFLARGGVVGREGRGRLVRPSLMQPTEERCEISATRQRTHHGILAGFKISLLSSKILAALLRDLISTRLH